MSELIRIAKAMADAGVCSRREAEALIEQGRVEINDETVETPATKVSVADVIALDGEIIRRPKANKATKLWMMHKPKGFLVTNHDPQGRQTVFDLIPKHFPRLIAVGRLDFNTEGLLLFTDNGAAARKMELPENNQKRVYRVRVQGKVDENTVKILAQGLKADGVKYRPVYMKIDKEMDSNTWVTMTLTEGKNREIRKIMEHFHHPVSRLIRVAYGDYKLGDLPVGRIVAV